MDAVAEGNSLSILDHILPQCCVASVRDKIRKSSQLIANGLLTVGPVMKDVHLGIHEFILFSL